MGKQIIIEIIIMIGIVLIFVIASIRFTEPIAEFTFFFVRDSGEVVGDTISNLITISGGMPGDIEIKYRKPSSDDYTYQINTNKKIIFVKANPSQEQKEYISEQKSKWPKSERNKLEEGLNIVIQEVFSSFGVELKNNVETPSFFIMKIIKDDIEGTKLELGE